MRRVCTFLLLLCTVFVFKLNAQEFDDPFANEELLEEINSDGDKSHNIAISWTLLGLFEQDERNNTSVLNSDFTPYIEKQSRVQIDLESQVRMSESFGFQGRWLVLQESLDAINTNDNIDSSDDELLEGYFRWQSMANDFNVSIGRIKPVWSNGFNWAPANLLYPYHERPNFDEDNIQQQKGWDLLEFEKLFGFWSVSALIADFQSDLLPESEYQSVLRFVIQNGWDASFIFYQVDDQKVDTAMTFSSLLNEATTLRFEWARQHVRELSIEPRENVGSDFWEKSVIGTNIRFGGHWDLSLEYLHNQHGLSNTEWESVYQNIESANDNILNGNQIAESLVTLTNTGQLFELGQLRRNYLYLSIADNQDANFWQYKQSVQVNLDDDSRLHRLQIIHNWTASFNTKLQFEWYEGCESCEFGLLPSDQSIRLSFYYRN